LEAILIGHFLIDTYAKQSFCEFDSLLSRSFSMNNIYAKTVHKEYGIPYELHPITSARGLRER